MSRECSACRQSKDTVRERRGYAEEYGPLCRECWYEVQGQWTRTTDQ